MLIFQIFANLYEKIFFVYIVVYKLQGTFLDCPKNHRQDV
jgi:hypothetical protein